VSFWWDADSFTATLWLVHLGATWFMVGLIWFVQAVHYPLFRYVPSEGWIRYENAHTKKTGRVVAFPMLLELATTIWLAIRLWSTPDFGWFLASGILLLVIWVSTALWQVPLHRKLEKECHPGAVFWLEKSNWIRTAAWTLRGLIVLALTPGITRLP
jgi:hypothetical protein